MDMNRREAIKMMAVGSAALWVPKGSYGSSADRLGATYPYVLPELPYAYDALEAGIDAETMRIHHTKHHAAYVNNLNKALEPYTELHTTPLADLLRNLDALPESIRTTVRNNGGGHANHDLFWKILTPGGSQPEGALVGQIEAAFGSLTACREQMQKAALSVFGSGWAWVVRDGETLVVTSSPNQDSPLMTGQIPLVGIDVWEHAYYLRYQNRRAEYVNAVLDHIDWRAVTV